MFLKTVSPEEATGEVANIYHHEQTGIGFVMEATRCWTTRPEILPLYEQFSQGIKANFSLGMRAGGSSALLPPSISPRPIAPMSMPAR
ncbi:hypothetical protein N8D56_17105 [Devosia sp. A8/3-2]|nr:hypothetical protein N8D56_17105 [Devosia sp. A8/3-2]